MDALLSAQYGLAPAIARALLQSLWQGALIALAAALVLAACSRRSAALRHAIGMGFLLAMVAVPALEVLRFWRQPAIEVNAGLLPVLTVPEAGVPGMYVQESALLAGLLCLLWLLGVVLMLLRHFGGWRLVGALDRKAHEVLPPDWQQRVLALQRALGISRTVLVRLGEDIAAPFTARLFRPVIWLPLSLIARLPMDQVEALVAHELAHIRRLDWLWNGLQCVVESLLFFHPGTWWLSRRIRQEREHACDDLAVAACGNALALAEALAELERHRHPFPRLVLAAHGGSLMKRITRLLTGPDSGPRWRLPATLLVLLASGTLLATQVDVSGSLLPDIHIQSSTDGTLGPGDERIIRANGVDGQRYYRAAVDRQGRLTELYKKDGKVLPIDAGVRSWVNEMSRISVPPPPPPAPPAPPAAAAPPAPPALSAHAIPAVPAVMPVNAVPPAPPAPPALAVGAVPPAPPAPPAPPLLTESAAFKAILRLVAADPAVVAKVGNPVTADPRAVDGNLRMDGDEGDAKLRFELGGPKGRIEVLVAAERQDGVWKLLNLDLRPATR